MSAWDAIVEAKIAEAQSAGAFDDLPGAGKPLNLDDDRLVPEDVRMAYRILRTRASYPPRSRNARKPPTCASSSTPPADHPERRRALAKLALLEARMEARGINVPRASDYYARLAGKLGRPG
jgi:hypothetical protein